MQKENFIKTYSEKFGDLIDYSQIPDEFHFKDELLNFCCKIHGKFQQSANAHRQSKLGCPMCGNAYKNPSFTHEQFIKKINEKYPDRDWEIISEYINMKHSLIVATKYGNCSIMPQVLYDKGKPTINCAINKTDYFIKRYKDKFKTRYDFSKFSFTCAKEPSFVLN